MLDSEMGREKLALIACCTVALYVVGGHLVWRMTSQRGERSASARLEVGRAGQLGLQLGALLVAVGIPVVVLWRGALYQEMGVPTVYAQTWRSDPLRALLALTGTRAVPELGRGLGVGAGVLVLLCGVWVWYEREVGGAGVRPEEATDLSVPWWKAARDAVSAQLLWAFYRGVALVWVADRVYAAFLGLCMVGLSCALSPWCRARLGAPRCSWMVVQNWVLAVGTALMASVVWSIVPLIVLHALSLWFSSKVLNQLTRTKPKPIASLQSLNE